MSQQHMDPQNTNERTAPYTTGYQQEPHLDEYRANAHGEKLLQPSGGTGSTSGHRLALAIVSLSLFVFAFVVGVAVTTSANSETIRQLTPVLGVFVIMFAILLIVINVLFNRKH